MSYFYLFNTGLCTLQSKVKSFVPCHEGV
jgi:hypothetical protein